MAISEIDQVSVTVYLLSEGRITQPPIVAVGESANENEEKDKFF
jgi:hypothetical protein